jgi:transcription initiation factor TFIIH subunit 3
MKGPVERSLTVLVIDVSPVAWGQRDLQRTASDKARLQAGKRSIGPAKLEECLSAVQAFCSASSSLERDSILVLVGVAGNEVGVVYPRKDALEEFFQNPENKLDSRKIQRDLVDGVAELTAKAALKQSSADNDNDQPLTASLAAMASAFSMSLCLINRFLVAANAGVSALHDHHSWNRGNGDDEGVITALSGGGGIGGEGGSKRKSKRSRAWSPRILLIQASDDRPADYNAFMNCAFASVKQNIVVDGCFIPVPGGAKSSSYLEQTCDMTGGLFLAPSGAAQANKALTEVLLTVFLPPRSCRSRLNLPAINKVDFRARSFDTGEILDMAYVCNQCLSIFKLKPTGRCPTCNAEIRSRKQPRTSTSMTTS